MESSTNVPEDARRSSDEETLQPTNDSEDGRQSAQEQLTELHLLARADLLSPAASFTLPSDVMVASSSVLEEEDGVQLDEGEARDRPRAATGGLSSFTAIMAASRKITASSPADPSTTFSDDTELSNEASFDEACRSLTVEIPDQCLSPKVTGASLPTLNEEVEGEKKDDDEAPETTSISTNPTFADKLFSSSVEEVPILQEQEPDEPDSDDSEFTEMVEHLSRGNLDSLILTPEDLTAHKLKRAHAALSSAQISSPTMPYVRTLVSIDMLQLQVQRLGVSAVRDSVSRAIQHLLEREESSSGVDSIALVTSSNIAAIVLEARQELATEASKASPPPPPLHRRASPVTSSKQQVRRASHTSPRSVRSPSSPTPSSSSRCGTPQSSDRRSILAKEGVHVLMQEKLASFDHRGQTNTMPAFRVRGANASLTDSAAKRRQRGLQYANDHVSHRIVHM